MSRPPLEVADLVRAAGEAFIERSRQWIRWKHVKVLRAIARCRTAALGGHIDECTGCGHRTTISYNSCRDRHCPKCQTAARDRWIEARRKELLPARYAPVVFTLPRHLAPLVLQNKKVCYDLLFRTSAETLLEVARDPQHRCRNRLLQRPAHLDAKTRNSPARPLCRSHRRSFTRSHPLDSFTRTLLSSQTSATESLSRQVHRRSQAGFP